MGGGCCWGIMGVETVVTVARLGGLEGASFTPATEGRLGWPLKGGPGFPMPGTGGNSSQHTVERGVMQLCGGNRERETGWRQERDRRETGERQERGDRRARKRGDRRGRDRKQAGGREGEVGERVGDSQRLFWLLAASTAIWAANWAALREAAGWERERVRPHPGALNTAHPGALNTLEHSGVNSKQRDVLPESSVPGMDGPCLLEEEAGVQLQEAG